MKVALLTFLLMLCLSSIVGGLRLATIGYVDPAALWFTNPDGTACKMPCLFGVRPDDMTMDQALQILKTHPMMADMQRRKLTDESNNDIGVELQGNHASLLIHNYQPYTGNGQQIRDIVLVRTVNGAAPAMKPQLEQSLDSSTTGSLLLYFGDPERMTFSKEDIGNRANYLFDVDLYYGGRRLAFGSRLNTKPRSFINDYISPDGRFSFLIVVHSGESLAGCGHWFGFINAEQAFKLGAELGDRC